MFSLPLHLIDWGILTFLVFSLNWQMLLQEQQTLSQTANCAPVLQTLFADHNLFNNETVDIGNFSFRNKHKQQVTLGTIES